MPRFLHESVIISTANEMIIDGTYDEIVLSGGEALAILRRLIPLMNGVLNLAEIGEHLPDIGEKDLSNIIEVLIYHGLIEEGEGQSVDLLQSPEQSLQHYRRLRPPSAYGVNGLSISRRFTNGAILVVTSGNSASIGRLLRDVLLHNGFVHAEQIEVTALRTRATGLEAWKVPLVVSLVTNMDSPQYQSDVDEWCIEQNLPWLSAKILRETGGLEVGPLFGTGTGVCFGCFNERRNKPSKLQKSTRPQIHDSLDLFATGLIATCVTNWYLSCGFCIGPSLVKRFYLSSSSPNTHVVPRSPGCNQCGLNYIDALGARSVSTIPRDADLPFILDEHLRFLLPDQTANRLGARQPALGNGKYSDANKRFSLPAVSLKMLKSFSRSTAPTHGNRVGLETLALLLAVAGGHQDQESLSAQPKRWIPSSGNLGSVQCYLFLSRSVEGLDEGWYAYEASSHSLVCLRQRGYASAVTSVLHQLRLDVKITSVELLIVLTGAETRLAQKYGALSHRLVHLDSGVAGAQMSDIAQLFGLFLAPATSANVAYIHNRLRLKSCGEVFTQLSVMLRTVPGGVDNTPVVHRSSNRKFILPQSNNVSTLLDSDLQSIVEALTKAEQKTHFFPEIQQSLSAFQSSASATSSLRSPLRVPTNGDELGSHDLEILRRRSSSRVFAELSIPLVVLTALLTRASLLLSNMSIPGNKPLIKLALVARRIEGIEQGLYDYDSDSRKLRQLSSLQDNQIRELYVQPEPASASAHLLFIGKFAEARNEHGLHGHNLLLRQIGAFGHRLAMTACELDLSGSLIAGLRPNLLSKHCFIDGYTEQCPLSFVSGIGMHPKTAREGL